MKVRSRPRSILSAYPCRTGFCAPPSATGPSENSGVERIRSSGTGQARTMSRKAAAVLSRTPGTKRKKSGWSINSIPQRSFLQGTTMSPAISPSLRFRSCSGVGQRTRTPPMIQKRFARDMWAALNRIPAGKLSSAFRNPPDAAVHSRARRVTPRHDCHCRVPAPGSEAPSTTASIALTIPREIGSLRAGMRHSGPSRSTYSSLRALMMPLAGPMAWKRLKCHTWTRLTA
mmetsp:Transcript_62846/g.141900  ORF Transcript_62846/g.141900 Transcript_62846/m.141900 type:complete len:230 (+) Transcript_62846:791-1480(+)